MYNNGEYKREYNNGDLSYMVQIARANAQAIDITNKMGMDISEIEIIQA